VIVDIPAFDSDYASLTITAYDHYVNIPITTRLGDFRTPEKLLVFSAHGSEPDRFRRITGQMESIRVTTLSEFTGGPPKEAIAETFPTVGKTDADLFANNLLVRRCPAGRAGESAGGRSLQAGGERLPRGARLFREVGRRSRHAAA
jgi:hypothetical protein